MQELENIIRNYSIEEIILLKKWINDYIVPLDKEKIVWLDLNSEEFTKFLEENYKDNDKNVVWYNSQLYNILGMQYLSFGNIIPGYNYLIGVIPNNVDKLTIVSYACYSKNRFFEVGQKNGVNWIQTIETNAFYKKNGLFKMINELLYSYIDLSKDLITTEEFDDGILCHTVRRIKDVLVNQGYQGEIYVNTEIPKEYIKKIKE